MSRAEIRRQKTNGSDPIEFNPTLVNPVTSVVGEEKATLPSPRNPTVPPPIEILLTEEEHQYFLEIRQTIDAFNKQAATVSQQANGALVMILKQHKLSPGDTWDLSEDARKVVRRVQTPTPAV